MDNRITENLPVEAADAEAEKEKKAAKYGKFNSVEALLAAYESLEAEFTRRSQRLKELENAANASAEPEEENSALQPQGEKINPFDGEEFIAAALASDEVKDAVISDYLKSVATKSGVPLIVGGGAVPYKRDKISSVNDAGKLVREFILKKY